jgi:hypothetical protein
VAKLEWEAAMVQKAAQDNMALAVMRNTAYYTNLARAIRPGDLVFCWSESVSRGADPINNRKLKLKWSGPYIFVRHVNSVMVEVGQIVSKKGGWKNHCFTVHITKVRLYKREGEKGPIRDPKDLLAFVPEDMEDLVKHADSIISFRSGPAHLPRGAGEEDQAQPRGAEGGPPSRQRLPRHRVKVRETPQITVPAREQKTTRLARRQRNLRPPSRKAGAETGTYRRRHRTSPPVPTAHGARPRQD